MIKAFENITAEECKLMFRIPALVTVLIAGADNNIDRNEVKEAMELTQLKKVTSREILIEYYEKVRENFNQQLMEFITQYPENTAFRQHVIIEEIKQVNNILPRLDPKFAIQFYASVKDFAKKIAEVSGGVFGYMPIGYEESKLVDLPMINTPE